MKQKTKDDITSMCWSINLYAWCALLVTLTIGLAIICIYAVANEINQNLVLFVSAGALWVFFTMYAVIAQITNAEVKKLKGGRQ